MKRSPANDRLIVRAERLSPSGEGVARHEGRELVVAGLLPGEEAEVRIVHRGQRRLSAAILARTKTDPARREPPCPHHGSCSGCPLMGVSEDRQRSLKREALHRLGLEVAEVIAVPQGAWGYRWSAKRVAFGRPGALRLGSYRRGSHEPADMAGCLVDHPALVAMADEIVARANALDIAPYDEQRRTGDLRYVWLRTDGLGGVLVSLITAKAEGSRVEELGHALAGANAVAVAVQDGSGNALRGRDLRMLRGAPLRLALAGAVVEVGALGFLQPNPPVAALAYEALVGQETGALAFDLYAGAGVTTALLKQRFAEVRACEAFAESAVALGIAAMDAGDFLAAQLEEGQRPDLVIANPPRAGLSERVCQLLARLAPPALRIMSCEPRSLARDLAALEAAGFRRGAIRAFDTLPQTSHIELVAALHAPEAPPSRGSW